MGRVWNLSELFSQFQDFFIQGFPPFKWKMARGWEAADATFAGYILFVPAGCSECFHSWFKELSIDLPVIIVIHLSQNSKWDWFSFHTVWCDSCSFWVWIFTTPLLPLPSIFGFSLLLGVILGVFFMVYSTRWLSRPRMWELLPVPGNSEDLGEFMALCS